MVYKKNKEIELKEKGNKQWKIWVISNSIVPVVTNNL